MRYQDFKTIIQTELQREPAGLTWVELRDRCGLPYERACQTWTKRLEREIGLTRCQESGRALVWKLAG